MDVDGGERNRETEGLVEKDEPVGVQETFNVGLEKLIHKGTIERNTQSSRFESPSITQRELHGATFVLGYGPVCRNNGEVDGLSTSSGHPEIRREKAGNKKTDHPKPRPKKAGVLNSGPVCSRNNGEIVKTSDGLSTSSGFHKIRKEESGNEKTEGGNHQKSRPKKTGCIKPTVKLGVGAQQRTSGGLKKNKKKKSGSTNNNNANSPVESEQKMEGVTGGSISDSNIANMNHLILENDRKMSAEEIWGIGKKLGGVFEGEESDLLLRLENMEAWDIEAWNNMEGEGKDRDGKEVTWPFSNGSCVAVLSQSSWDDEHARSDGLVWLYSILTND
ncbi:hypothetical protein Ancab_030387 [Ancistrocladus abbreviatus]